MRLPHSWQLGSSALFSNVSFEAGIAGTAKPIGRGSAVSAGAPDAIPEIAWNAAAIGPAAASATGDSAERALKPVGDPAGPGSSRAMTPAFSLRSAVRNFDASQRKM